jgi:hypothetical protein
VRALGILVCTLVGLVQFLATWDGVTYGLGIHSVLGFLLALLLGAFPIVGALTGIYGSIVVWNWPWWQAVLLFFGLQMIAMLAIGAAAGFGRKRTA